MVEMQDRDVLLASLRGYLEDLAESGVDELSFEEVASAAATTADGQSAAPAPSAPPARVGVASSAILSSEAGTSASNGDTSPTAPAATAPVAAGATSAQSSPRHGAPAPAATAPPTAAPASPAPEAAPAPSITAQGNPRARLLFVICDGGLQGPSGTLLSKIIMAMGFAPEDVCLLGYRSQQNASDKALREALLSRIATVAPEAVVALGEQAAQLLLQSDDPIAKLRGRFRELNGIALMATLHPDQMLADESLKRQVWMEMQQVMKRLGISR